ncbi:MAG TPA: alpha/beta hydrolase [Actinomycetota bacterium]|nr:alpha/beta hydrolase [Actinomycetota bacterium]
MRRAAAVAACVAVVLSSGCGGGGDVAARTVRFSTDDGVELEGDVRGGGTTGVALAHMYPTDRTSWEPFAERLAAEGYLTLAFDFRGYGGSEGERTIPEIWRDVVAAAGELRSHGAERVVLVGASMGGTASLVAASRSAVDGVVTISAPSTFEGLTASPDVVRAVQAPKLFVAASADGAAAAAAQSFYNDSPQPKRVEIVGGDEHGTELLEGSHGEVVRNVILDFLRV